ncbi:hypothetical protein [Yersinia enterocolitica]|uniref:hypothetical protein n=1 Tax=Yersinia enterocolitica TaxID=630 RepID=UPI0032F97B90|nr:hypothetical protein [Yersinia enterocolitica]HDL7101393.1 hypothetical protein [Yersinia enterocolitica]HDL7857805.1 hypothetical protein [Yersinia enterocolitica]
MASDDEIISMTRGEYKKLVACYMIGDVMVNKNLATTLISEIYQPVCNVTTALILKGKAEGEILEAAQITARVMTKTLTAHLLERDCDHTFHCVSERIFHRQGH